MTFTPNLISAMGSLLILATAFFMGTDGLVFAALSMAILAVILTVWVLVSVGICYLTHRLAIQLEAAARFAKDECG